jgi:small subunit ribosomal protein S24e
MMEIEILEDKKNPLLERREVKFNAAFNGATPSRKDVRAKLVAILSSDRELTVLDKFDTNYGSQTAKGYAKVYDSKDAMKVEAEHKVERNFPKPKEGAEAPAAEAKPKEAQ